MLYKAKHPTQETIVDVLTARNPCVVTIRIGDIFNTSLSAVNYGMYGQAYLPRIQAEKGANLLSSKEDFGVKCYAVSRAQKKVIATIQHPLYFWRGNKTSWGSYDYRGSLEKLFNEFASVGYSFAVGGHLFDFLAREGLSSKEIAMRYYHYLENQELSESDPMVPFGFEQVSIQQMLSIKSSEIVLILQKRI